MYSPAIGRFLQMDPLGYVDGLNLYAYVGNNPVNWLDPSGQSTMTIPWNEIIDWTIPEIISKGGLIKGLIGGIGGAVIAILGDAESAGETAEELRDLEEQFRDAMAKMIDEAGKGGDTCPANDRDDGGPLSPKGRPPFGLPPKMPWAEEVDPADYPPEDPYWKPHNVKDFPFGCEEVAKQIKEILGGGDIVRITPKKPYPKLGDFKGESTFWEYHEVVVKDGRVYDAFTGSKGMPIDEYKSLWEYADDIDFNF